MNQSRTTHDQTLAPTGPTMAPMAGPLCPRRWCPPCASWKPPTRSRRRSAFQRELADLLHTLCRAPHAADPRPTPQRSTGRRAHLSQARRPGPHRRAQDQQRPGAGAAGPADGQAAHRRRDRRRPARRGHGHRLRAAGAGVRGLYGHGGHRAAEAQRLSHEAAGRRGAPV